jgi:integrase
MTETETGDPSHPLPRTMRWEVGRPGPGNRCRIGLIRTRSRAIRVSLRGRRLGDLKIGGGASRIGRGASQRWESVMSSGSTIAVNAAGRRRSPATMPGYLAGRAPRNKGMQYPPDPPRAEEIVLVMRQAGRDRHGLRVRALVAVLWRAGLGISEALALNETDIDDCRGSLLIRHGKGDKRREAGMDEFGFEQVAAWLAHRVSLPPGPLFCVIDGSTRGRRWSATAARAELRALAVDAGVRRRFAPHQLRHAHALARPRRCGNKHHPAPARSYRSRNDQHLSARDRSQRDHRRRSLTPPADHLRHGRADPLTAPTLASPRLPLRPDRALEQEPAQRFPSGDIGAASSQRCGLLL